MSSVLKPGPELTRAFDHLLLERYYQTGGKNNRNNLSNGTPLIRPFEPARRAVEAVISGPEMALYARGGGPKRFRDKVLPFCEEQGIAPARTTLTHENVTFGIGSTYLYAATLKILSERGAKTHPGKRPVILMPAPTYGVFSVQPVECGYDVETFPLQEKEGWQIAPDALARAIRKINQEPKRYVAALYHANPHNPSGAVADGERTQQIARVLKKNNVFAIDDMAYAGIEHKGRAVPLAAHNFDGGITLFTLSKTYCLPRARAAFACGPASVIREIDDYTDRHMISVPAAVFAAAASCFSAENKALSDEYLPANSAQYMSYYQLLKAMVCGIDSVDSISGARRNEISTIVREATGSATVAGEILANGLPRLRLMNDAPESGFFAMVQVQGMDDLFYGTTRLTSSFQFAAAAVDIGKVLTLPLCLALAGPAHRDTVRLSFGGMAERTLAKAIKGIQTTLNFLKEKPDATVQCQLEKTSRHLTPEFDL